MKIVVATGNKNKMREIHEIMDHFGFDIVSMKEVGITDEPEENGTTFEENAIIKAKAVYDKLASDGSTDHVVIADDSGLVVDALNGEPGIYSARYLGKDTPYEEKNAQIIDRLSDVPEDKRTARFVCAVAAILPGGKEKVVSGTMEGLIAHETAGEHGFGYDPLFYLPEYGKTSAQLLPEEKNAISHRGKALRAMEEVLAAELGE